MCVCVFLKVLYVLTNTGIPPSSHNLIDWTTRILSYTFIEKFLQIYHVQVFAYDNNIQPILYVFHFVLVRRVVIHEMFVDIYRPNPHLRSLSRGDKDDVTVCRCKVSTHNVYRSKR